MAAWDPNLYLRFEKERTQPAKDLVSRIELEKPKRIIDIGCGPGNSTVQLRDRWPHAEIFGIDNSQEMIQKAGTAYPDMNWVVHDITENLSGFGSFDLVFSNAVIQWVPDQRLLLTRLFAMLNPGGVLAVQVPNAWAIPISVAIREVADEPVFQPVLSGLDDTPSYREPSFYYDVLTGLTNDVHVWETTYYHALQDHEAIVEWYRSTGMKPYLERLDEPGRVRFIASVLGKVRMAYPVQTDGHVLFPFRRVFFAGKRVPA